MKSPLDAQQSAMAELTASFKTKAAKIRALHAQGYRRSDIARFLNIRYQHVRNVVVRAEESAADPYKAEPPPEQEWIAVAANGRMVVPASYRRMLGLEGGGPVLLKIENGALRLIGRAAALGRAQATVAQYSAKGGSMVDELLAERKLEAAREKRK